MIQTWTPLSQRKHPHSDLELFSCRNSQMQVGDPWCMHRDLLHQPSNAMPKLRKRHLLSPGPVKSLQNTFWESHSTCTQTTNHWSPAKENFSWSHPATQNHICTPCDTTRCHFWQWTTVCFLGFFQVCKVIQLRLYYQQSQVYPKQWGSGESSSNYQSSPEEGWWSPSCSLGIQIDNIEEWVQSSRTGNVYQTTHHYTCGFKAAATKDARLWLSCPQRERSDWILATRRSRLDSPEPNGGNSGHRGSTKVLPGDNSQWGSQEKSPATVTTPPFPQLYMWRWYCTSGGCSHSRASAPASSWWLIPNKQQKSSCTTQSVQTYNVKDTLPIPPEKGRCCSRLRLSNSARVFALCTCLALAVIEAARSWSESHRSRTPHNSEARGSNGEIEKETKSMEGESRTIGKWHISETDIHWRICSEKAKRKTYVETVAEQHLVITHYILYSHNIACNFWLAYILNYTYYMTNYPAL